MKYTQKIITMLLLSVFVLIVFAHAETISRNGTTAANFLEIGYGSSEIALGDAVVSTVDNLSAAYWNPAGLALMRNNQAQFMVQPWIAGINTSFAGVGILVPGLGTMAISYYSMDYGKVPVTTMLMQDGTGENYSANEYAVSLSFARKITNWFAFGASGKMVRSSIWHTSGTAFALDFGSIIKTQFFSRTGKRTDGMSIGMSISNYGTPLTYQGQDLLQPIDLYPDQAGNYDNVEGQFKTQSWELPLIFRIGVAVRPIVSKNQRVTLALDALHLNNNSEYVNTGLNYKCIFPTFGAFNLSAGYKGLFMVDSEFGPSLGFGFEYRPVSMGINTIQFDYAARDVGIFGFIHSYSFRMTF